MYMAVQLKMGMWVRNKNSKITTNMVENNYNQQSDIMYSRAKTIHFIMQSIASRKAS